ncbi:zinc ribbon domain-containing protein [Bacillus sp. FJAT-42315]|uniref:zinc ribbon domain-containing protein n=1 Tax=Bacillus sp. FJAT-42315 TaxID=2014077 RepID=UPI000C232261|nr:hypothetical protein [Bacillus sp. FJAT-42315]
MRHCQNCGEALESSQSFCTSCGQTVQQVTEELVQKKSLSKLQKGLIIGSVLFVIIGIVGWKTAEAINSPFKVVKQFEKAVKSGDKETLASLLNSGQDEMPVNEAAASRLIDYFKEDPSMLGETKEALRMQAKQLEDGMSVKQKENMLSVVESGRKWLFLPSYGLDFQKVYFKVSINQPSAKLVIDGEDQGKVEENKIQTLGPFLPIPHELQASYKSTYTVVDDSKIIHPQDEASNKIDVEFDLSGAEIYLTSNYDQATVFINGKSTNKTVADIDTLGPVPVDGSMKIHAEVKEDGQLLKSEPIVITEAYKDDEVELWVDDTVIQEAKERAAEEEAERAANRVSEEAEIRDVIYNHYSGISSGDYGYAYDFFSSGRKGKMSLSKWSEGFDKNIGNTVNYATVEELNGDKAVASFEMVSHDYQADGSTLVQTWGGKWYLVKESTGWKLSKSEIKKLNAKIE